MREAGAIIIGAGAAGLAAATDLLRAGVAVTLPEARDRAGGRGHTVESQCGNFPLELGAEFVHGSRKEVWKLVRAARAQTCEVPDCHWTVGDKGLIKNPKFWEQLDKVM